MRKKKLVVIVANKCRAAQGCADQCCYAQACMVPLLVDNVSILHFHITKHRSL